MHGTVLFRVHHSEYGQSAVEGLAGLLFILVSNGGAKRVQQGVDSVNTFKTVEFEGCPMGRFHRFVKFIK